MDAQGAQERIRKAREYKKTTSHGISTLRWSMLIKNFANVAAEEKNELCSRK